MSRPGGQGDLWAWAGLLLDLCGVRRRVGGERIESAWMARRRLRLLPVRDLDDIFGAGAILVLAPHPDDEVIGCGGMIAQARAAGRAVHLVFLTDGAASHPGSRLRPVELARIRQAEARAAALVLGVQPEHLVFLALPDGDAPRTGPAFDEAVRRVAAIVQDTSIATLVTTAPDDPHPDHRAAHHVARAAADASGAKVLAFPIWQWRVHTAKTAPELPIRGNRLNVGPQRLLKRRALAAHASQISAVVADSPRSGKGLRRLAGLRFETYLEYDLPKASDTDP